MDKMTLAEIAELARTSNPELGAIGNKLVNYYTGHVNATFEDHEGEGAEDTALFLASALRHGMRSCPMRASVTRPCSCRRNRSG